MKIIQIAFVNERRRLLLTVQIIHVSCIYYTLLNTKTNILINLPMFFYLYVFYALYDLVITHIV